MERAELQSWCNSLPPIYQTTGGVLVNSTLGTGPSPVLGLELEPLCLQTRGVEVKPCLGNRGRLSNPSVPDSVCRCVSDGRGLIAEPAVDSTLPVGDFAATGAISPSPPSPAFLSLGNVLSLPSAFLVPSTDLLANEPGLSSGRNFVGLDSREESDVFG